MKYCPDCGCENIDEAQFCRNCGLKFDAEVQKTPGNVTPVNQTHDLTDNSLLSTLLYKTDRITGELRISKSKVISIAVFIIMFIFEVNLVYGGPIFPVFLSAIIFGLLFAVPTYVICTIAGYLIDRIR